MKTLNQQFFTTAIFIAMFLALLGVYTHFSMQRSFENQQLAQSIYQLHNTTGLLANTQKDFLIKEAVNPVFFQTEESRFITQYDSLYNEAQALIEALHRNSRIYNLQLTDSLHRSANLLTAKRLHFHDLTSALHQYGYESYGLSGFMRQAIHRVESQLSQNNHHELSALMLMLRRHEKDFMLRKDPIYIERFNNGVQTFIRRMRAYNIDENFISAVQEYQKAFHTLAEKDISIHGETGIAYNIESSFTSLSPLLQNISARVVEHASSQVRFYRISLLIAFLVLPIGIILVYYRLSHRIIKQLKSMKCYLSKLGNGELPPPYPKGRDDEIGQMIKSINILTHNLKNTRNFAMEVGKGNFNTEIDVFGNQGDLGGSLIQMKTQLEEVAKEQLRQKEEEAQRTWIAEGNARFAQLLRDNYSSQEDMAYYITKNLVKYLSLDQGGLFLLKTKEGSDNEERTFKLMGCHAYDRKKFLNIEILWGEGFIGACALEKLPIYMTDIPQEYAMLTSGLGGAKPKSILILPLLHEDQVVGVIEMSGFREIEEYKRDFAFKISTSIAAQFALLQTNENTKNLLASSEKMAQELIQQEEELKQNMEEMTATQEESERIILRLREDLSEREAYVKKLLEERKEPIYN